MKNNWLEEYFSCSSNDIFKMINKQTAAKYQTIITSCNLFAAYEHPIK